MKESEERKIILGSYLKLIDFLSQALGKNCEVVLHAVEGDKIKIIAIKNGANNNRRVGDELSLVGAEMKQIYESTGYTVNNREKDSAGKDIKSNSYYIQDSTGTLIGILCINLDLTAAQNAKNFLEDFMGTAKVSSAPKIKAPSDSIKDFTLKVIEETISSANIPVNRMTRTEKIEILKILKDKEVFRIKGATRIVAKYLKFSETSIYRYLKDLE